MGQVQSVLLNKRRLWKPTNMLHSGFILKIPPMNSCSWCVLAQLYCASCRIPLPQEFSPFMWLVGHQHLQKETFQRKLTFDTLGGLFQRGARWLYWCVAIGTPALRHCILYNAHLIKWTRLKQWGEVPTCWKGKKLVVQNRDTVKVGTW